MEYENTAKIGILWHFRPFLGNSFFNESYFFILLLFYLISFSIILKLSS